MITDILFWAAIGLSVPLYWLFPRERRPLLLALVSFAYLATLDPGSVAALSFFTVLMYFSAPRHRHNSAARRVAAALILLCLAYLGFYKFLPAAASQFAAMSVFSTVVLPLGISYYSFKLVHYCVERSRGNLPDHGFWDFAAYLYLFPIFTAGPIERFDHFMANRAVAARRVDFAHGVIRIAHGLIKKLVLIPLVLLPLFGEVRDIDTLLARLGDLHPVKVWGFFVLSFLVAYLDFSAYSDLAIGVSRLYGIRIGENFNWPILASNIGAFWKRWHMSLSHWCQTYVYMPLIGLTRNPYVASYGAFVVMGLWHSASPGWIMWGLWHATGTACYVYWTQLRRRRKWRGLDRPGLRWLGMPATLAYASCGGVFTLAMENGGVGATAAVFARLLGVNLL